MKLSKEIEFLKSALSLSGKTKDLNVVIKWLKEQNDAVSVKITKTKFEKLEKWAYDIKTGNLRHDSGKFFSIDGINIRTNWGQINEWEQPIINQPEIGYLGFITKEFDGILHFLVQAKIEPGNVNFVQLSPTLQATHSNYSQVHNGRKPLYLDYFQNATSDQVLLDQLQSEQGARFLKKRNRNIIIKVNEEVEIYNNFIWLTLGQIKHLMQIDNLVNMDTRTVISGIPFGEYSEQVTNMFSFFGIHNESKKRQNAFLKSALVNGSSYNSTDAIITFVTKQKSKYDLEINNVDLKKLKRWIYSEDSISHVHNKFFSVIPVQVEIGNREVVNWCQPMIEPAQEGLCAFICKEINGILHFVVQSKLECGNRDITEFAPTVQCLTGDYRETQEGTLPFLDRVLNVKTEQIVFDSYQSEEGGRFYKEQNRNMLIIIDDLDIELPENYIWMTLNQLYVFLRFNNFLNIQARSLIAAISFI
jgi:oxidase EvaA